MNAVTKAQPGPVSVHPSAPNAAEPSRAPQKPSTPEPQFVPSTASGVRVTAKAGESTQQIREKAFAKMAEEAGLSPAAQAEFVRRASALDDGKINAPAASSQKQPQAMSDAQVQRALSKDGAVTVAPTQAQAGLLNMMRSDAPSGAAVGFALPVPRNQFNGAPGQSAVTPAVASEILSNVAQGKPPFNPDLGEVGRVSWFVTDGQPHTGVANGKSVILPVEVANTSGKPALKFDEKALLEIFNRHWSEANAQVEQQVRKRAGKSDGEPLSSKERNSVERGTKSLAEKMMWTEVGETVRASESGIGKVELKDSIFSKSGNGEFTLTSRPENIRLPKGAAAELVNAIKSGATPAEPGVLEAAEKLASNEKWGGKVQGAFRVGGKVLLVLGLANDTYRIYTATDKVKTSVEVAGGWGGAVAAGSAFAAWYTPADVAGPWAWVGHGVGTLAAGAIGYYAGSEVTKSLYELTVEGKPIDIGFLGTEPTSSPDPSMLRPQVEGGFPSD